ncbi:hypothetical protein CRYUN_Cryun29cG0075300 [Craigia yunnanensis]
MLLSLHGLFHFNRRIPVRGVVLPGCDFFDVLWSTRNVYPYGFGVFDALFSAFVDLECLRRVANVFQNTREEGPTEEVFGGNGWGWRCSISLHIQYSTRLYVQRRGIGRCKNVIWTNEKIGLTPDIVTYNSLIDGYGKVGLSDEVLFPFEEMKNDKIEETKPVMGEMKESGLSPNPVIYTTVMDSYFKAGKITEALNLLEKCGTWEFNLQPNVAVYTVLIDGLCKNNFIEAAKNMFDEMLSKNLIPDKTAYTALIDGNIKHGNFQEVLNLRNKMVEPLKNHFY